MFRSVYKYYRLYAFLPIMCTLTNFHLRCERATLSRYDSKTTAIILGRSISLILIRLWHFQCRFSEAATSLSESALFAISLSCDARDTRRREEVVIQEAITTCTPSQWSGYMQILSLSSVVGRTIFSVYPNVYHEGKLAHQPTVISCGQFLLYHWQPRRHLVKRTSGHGQR